MNSEHTWANSAVPNPFCTCWCLLFSTNVWNSFYLRTAASSLQKDKCFRILSNTHIIFKPTDPTGLGANYYKEDNCSYQPRMWAPLDNSKCLLVNWLGDSGTSGFGVPCLFERWTVLWKKKTSIPDCVSVSKAQWKHDVINHTWVQLILPLAWLTHYIRLFIYIFFHSFHQAIPLVCIFPQYSKGF